MSSSTKNKLIDLYYYILQGEKENRNKLLKLSEGELIDYIQCIFDANVKSKADEIFNQMKTVFYDSLDSPQTYEDLLIKYENDIRSHIKTELEQALIIDALRMQVSSKDSQPLSSKSISLNKIKKSIEMFKKENQNLKRLLLSYELMKEKADENEKKLKLKVYKQDKENQRLSYRINRLNSKQQDKVSIENSKYCQFETLTQKNSMNLIVNNNHHCPLIKKHIIKTRSSSRKDSLNNDTKHLRTRSLMINNDHSLSKPKRNRSALDFSSMSRNQHVQHSSRLATDRAVIKSYNNASLVKKPKNFCKNGKKNSNDMSHLSHFSTHIKNDYRLFKANSQKHTQIY